MGVESEALETFVGEGGRTWRKDTRLNESLESADGSGGFDPAEADGDEVSANCERAGVDVGDGFVHANMDGRLAGSGGDFSFGKERVERELLASP